MKDNNDFSNFDDIIVEDSDNYRSTPTSMKDIVLEQLRRCMTEGSKEMSKGGIKKRLVNNRVVEVEEEDQIEVFSNSVDLFFDLTQGDFEDFPELKVKLDKVEEEEKEIITYYNQILMQVMDKKKQLSKNGSDQTINPGTLKQYNHERDLKLLKIARKKLRVIIELAKGKNFYGEGDG